MLFSVLLELISPPLFFPPQMAWVISAVHLNYSGIKFQVEQHSSNFIISQFILEL